MIKSLNGPESGSSKSRPGAIDGYLMVPEDCLKFTTVSKIKGPGTSEVSSTRHRDSFQVNFAVDAPSSYLERF